MEPESVLRISSPGNPLLKELRRLSQDNSAYRKLGRIWLEGDHLCRAALAHGQRPAQAVFSESCWAAAPAALAQAAAQRVILPDRLFSAISSLESAAGVGFVLALPSPPALDPTLPCVVLDQVQDTGNVGSILRSAAAFGIRQIVALQGTAALWSPKVLRAGMGAHFGLRLVEGLAATALDALALPIITTSSHLGSALHQAQLPAACCWAFGHEGQGVGPEVQRRAALTLRIAQPGGEESLNVAAAAAICLYAASITRQP